ncbi:MAG: M28 family peptidase [Bacteroidia bacterium]
MKSFLVNFCIILITTYSAWAQNLPKSEKDILQSLEHNLSYLADDRMEGRLMGSRGEKLAYEFLVENFQSLNLRPKGTQGFLQPFTVKKLTYAPTTSLTIKSKTGEFKFDKMNPVKNFPIHGTGVGKVNAKCVWLGYGIEAPELNYNDFAGKKGLNGKVFVIRYGHPKTFNTSEIAPFSSNDKKIENAIKYGASAVLFVNSDANEIEPDFKPIIRSSNLGKIPIYFLTHQTRLDSAAFVQASATLQVDTTSIELKAHNVLGYVDYKADYTVIIGAHYDHLGYNELGGSTYRKTQNEPPQIHHGADDNASGTVALIELAEIIQKSPFRNHNYLFIAFSGEEQGLLGSKYFTENPTINLSNVNYMINMDMIGRLDTVKNMFQLSGTGTSPRFDSVLNQINTGNIKIKYDPSGTGASDHTSFYNMGIPVLHYFTGTHADYHKPSDKWELINFNGMLVILKHIYALIGKLDKQPKLAFTKTKEVHSGNASPFKVTLGIMPDYLYEGKGVKLDGTTPGKPAANAGLEKGDIILKIGEIEIADMETYMQSLSKLDKGQKVKLLYIRGNKQLETEVQF